MAMNEIQLNTKQEQVHLEVQVNRNSKVEIFLHQLSQHTSIRIANLQLEKGKKKLSFQKDQLEKGVYIYTVNQDDMPTDFGRLVVH